MSDITYNCPKSSCGAELNGPRCDACGTDLRELFTNEQVTFENVTAGLVQGGGAYYYEPMRALVVPGAAEWNPLLICPEKYTKDEAEKLAYYVRRYCNLPPARCTAKTVQYYLHCLHHTKPDCLPCVTHIGDKPQLFRAGDALVWPFTTESAQQRIYQGLKYTGELYTPQPTGAFKEFLASVRCRNEDSREVIRAWMLTALCQTLYAAGHAPMLLLCAKDNGAGKTTTANVIAYILGGGIEVFWEPHYSVEDLYRKFMDQANRVIVVDNIRPEPGKLLFDYSSLASILTAQTWNVKMLYKSMGSVRVPNRYVFIGTANNPRFSSEILTRMGIAELQKMRADARDWATDWMSRRREVLEDMMHTAITNWAEGAVDIGQRRCRFPTWLGTAARLLRRVPVMIPEDCMVRPPMEMCIDELWAALAVKGRAPLTELCNKFRAAVGGTVGTINRQQEITVEGISAELQEFPGRYTVQKQEDQLWIVKS